MTRALLLVWMLAHVTIQDLPNLLDWKITQPTFAIGDWIEGRSLVKGSAGKITRTAQEGSIIEVRTTIWLNAPSPPESVPEITGKNVRITGQNSTPALGRIEFVGLELRGAVKPKGARALSAWFSPAIAVGSQSGRACSYFFVDLLGDQIVTVNGSGGWKLNVMGEKKGIPPGIAIAGPVPLCIAFAAPAGKLSDLYLQFDGKETKVKPSP